MQIFKAKNTKPQHIPQKDPGHRRVSKKSSFDLLGNSAREFGVNGEIPVLGGLTCLSFSPAGDQLVSLERPRVLHSLRGDEDPSLQPPAHGGQEAAGPALLSSGRP